MLQWIIEEGRQNLPSLAVPQQEGKAACAASALIEWVETNHEQIFSKLSKYGALLFRGFTFQSAADLESFSGALSKELLTYSGGNSPRTKVSDKVYTSTEFAMDAKLSLHNEASYLKNMPALVFFYCDIAAKKGGATVLGDSRRIFEKIDKPVMARFQKHGVTYINNLHDGYGFGKSWQQTFETKDKQEAENQLRAQDYEFKWHADGLRTTQRSEATCIHPTTGEACWVNQAEQWHPSSLPLEVRESLTAILAEEDFPHYACFGDGTPIPEADLTHIRQVMAEEERRFDWQQGDVLLCDNRLVAHGREPFEGERRVLVAMA